MYELNKFKLLLMSLSWQEGGLSKNFIYIRTRIRCLIEKLSTPIINRQQSLSHDYQNRKDTIVLSTKGRYQSSKVKCESLKTRNTFKSMQTK